MTEHETLVHASAYFDQDPTLWSDRLAEVGRSKGYDYIKETVLMLQDCHQDDKKALGLLMLLRQPEWEWKDCENDENIQFFGLTEDDVFVAQGYYITGKHETGEVRVLLRPGRTANYIVGMKVIEDPREAYKEHALRMRVWKRYRKYWVVLAGRVVDLAKYGFTKEDIRETGGRGYFSQYPAFAIIEGPCKTKEEARSLKSALS
jgi:hypothetical protein